MLRSPGNSPHFDIHFADLGLLEKKTGLAQQWGVVAQAVPHDPAWDGSSSYYVRRHHAETGLCKVPAAGCNCHFDLADSDHLQGPDTSGSCRLKCA